VATGRVEEGVAEAKRALELDPFSEFTRDFTEWACYLARRYELTVEQSRKSLELSPEFPWAPFDLGQAYEGMGRSDEAIQAYLKAEEVFGMNQDRLAELRKVYQQFGAKGYWRKTLELCEREFRQPRKFASVSGFGYCDYMQNVDAAKIQVRLGDHDAAFRYLEKADRNRDADILYLNADSRWDALRSDPRFRDFVRRLGLPH